jgi:hypothetical protein
MYGFYGNKDDDDDDDTYYTDLSKQLLRHLRHAQRKLCICFIKTDFLLYSIKGKALPVLN